MPVDFKHMNSQNNNEWTSQPLSWDILERAHSIYLEEEPRDAMYRISTKLIDNYWDSDFEVSNALGVLLLTWNSAFYRYGSLVYDQIEQSIKQNRAKLYGYRKREIFSLSESEYDDIKATYNDFLCSLKSVGKKRTRVAEKVSYSPVSVGKALHLLCPNFFPLWDNKIAKAYGCQWHSSTISFQEYWKFINISRKQSVELGEISQKPLSLNDVGELKLIDEYNCIRFTKKRSIF